jgi:hypothetical protein
MPYEQGALEDEGAPVCVRSHHSELTGREPAWDPGNAARVCEVITAK